MAVKWSNGGQRLLPAEWGGRGGRWKVTWQSNGQIFPLFDHCRSPSDQFLRAHRGEVIPAQLLDGGHHLTIIPSLFDQFLRAHPFDQF